MEWVLVKTLLSLVAVIGLMFAVLFVMKRFVYGGGTGATSLVDIQIIGSRSLQPKQSVHVLRVLNKVIIVGTTAEGMQTLGEITDEESLRMLNERTTAQPVKPRWFAKQASGSTPAFAELLGSHMGKIMWKGAK